MLISQIKPIIRTSRGFTGGIEDVGNFKEGFCFKLITLNVIDWIICNDSLAEKENWMTFISRIKGVFSKFEQPEKVLEGNVVVDGSF